MTYESGAQRRTKMNERRCRRPVIRATLAALVAGVGVGFPACASSPAAPTGTSTSSATIDSVVATFRGAVVESSPLVIQSPDVLSVEVKVTLISLKRLTVDGGQYGSRM
jgi:hypothetical protein